MDKTTNDELVSFVVVAETPKTKFLASLSDGRTVIQDERPKERHAWARLAKWLSLNPGISITELRLHGPRGVDIKMPPNQKGYFVGQKKSAVWGGPQFTYVGVGYYDGQKVVVSWYRQPKFDHSFTEERDASTAGFFLIENK